MSLAMSLIRCDLHHVEAIRSILNDVILTSTASYDYEPKSADWIRSWFQTKLDSRLPVFGIQTADGDLIAYASFGPFRPWAAYRYTIEHSIYVHRDYQGQGLGRTLLQTLITTAIDDGFHTMIGGIDGANMASIRLHQSLGFSKCGEIREAGFKFDRWLDLHFYQRFLEDRVFKPQHTLSDQ